MAQWKDHNRCVQGMNNLRHTLRSMDSYPMLSKVKVYENTGEVIV